MSSKQILDYWKESFQLMKWGQLRLLLLGGLNNFIRACKLIFYFGWWLIPFLIIPILQVVVMEVSLAWLLIESAIMIVVLNLIFFIYILSSRPSLERKDYVYFSTYAVVAPGVLGFALLAGIFSNIGTIFFLSCFFFLDSKLGLKDVMDSLLNSVKFLFYFPALVVPFLVLNWILFNIFSFIIPITLHNVLMFVPAQTALNVICVILITLFFMLGSFFQISLLSMFYIKIKHTHPELFMENKY